jgi:hypothetical protein
MADTPHGGPATPADGRLHGRVGLITGAAGGIGARRNSAGPAAPVIRTAPPGASAAAGV